MIKTFLNWLLRNPTLEEAKCSGLIQVNTRTGKQTPVEETDAGKLFAIIAEGRCPDCHSMEGFFEGPSGGMSTNIFCAACNQRFNITPMIGIAERV